VEVALLLLKSRHFFSNYETFRFSSSKL